MIERKDILLRAAYDLLKQASESHLVEQATEIIVHYDDADCDGYCLMEDIAVELGIERITIGHLRREGVGNYPFDAPALCVIRPMQ